MEYTPLVPNPQAPKPLILLALLDTMNKQPFDSSKYPPFSANCHPTNFKYHYHKKLKQNNQPPPRNSNSFYPLQSLKPNENPTINKTNPKPPSPTLVNLTNSGKLHRMLRNSQPGLMVYLPNNGDVFNLFKTAKWENYVFYRGQNYYTYLVAEFYANMEIKQRLDGLYYVNSFVNGRNIFVDHNVINRALRIGNKTADLPCINIFDKLVFDKSQFELYLGMFCEEDVPAGLCVQNCGVSFRHFTAKYQQLAIILRSNILPKPTLDRFFDFTDLHVMFKLVSNTVDFNMNYVIVLNMVYAHHKDYLPYGLLLTAIFESYYVNMPRNYAGIVDYCAVENMTQPKVPLKDCKPHPVISTVIPSLLPKDDINEFVKQLKEEVDSLKAENVELKIRLEQIEMRLLNKGKEVVGLDESTSKLYAVELVNELFDTDKDETLPDASEMGKDLGFVAVDSVE